MWERGKAEADLVTDREGAECEKTMSLDCRSQRNVYNGMCWTRGHCESGKDWDGEQANKARVSGGMRLLGMTEVRGHDTGFRQHAEGLIEIAGLPRTKEGGFVSKLAFLRGVYPGANPKVAEGGPVGHKT